jgi:hypothetical protein
MKDSFNCPRCGAHDYGLFAASMLPCVHCAIKERDDLLAALSGIVERDLAYYNGYVTDGRIPEAAIKTARDVVARVTGYQNGQPLDNTTAK